jgi:two-component system phosphate regulon response regulator OmpR
VTTACVLVVDDDAGVRRMLVEYLGSHDYEVTAVGSGTEMRAALALRVPDVVLLDVGLPG